MPPADDASNAPTDPVTNNTNDEVQLEAARQAVEAADPAPGQAATEQVEDVVAGSAVPGADPNATTDNVDPAAGVPENAPASSEPAFTIPDVPQTPPADDSTASAAQDPSSPSSYGTADASGVEQAPAEQADTDSTTPQPQYQDPSQDPSAVNSDVPQVSEPLTQVSDSDPSTGDSSQSRQPSGEETA